MTGEIGQVLSFSLPKRGSPMKRSFGKKYAAEAIFWEGILSEVDCNGAYFQRCSCNPLLKLTKYACPKIFEMV